MTDRIAAEEGALARGAQAVSGAHLDIGLEAGGDVDKSNANKLHDVSGELPPTSVISQVDGNRSEEIADWFTSALEKRSTTIASRVAKIRQFVAANAEALIDDIAPGKSLTGSAAGASAGATAGTSATPTSTDAAENAKRAFGG